jgi:hypothetical protein
LERGRWGLAEYRAVDSGEASELLKTETVGDLCNVHRIGTSSPQHNAYFSQTAQQYVPNRAHTEKLGTARPEGLVAHPDQFTEFCYSRGAAEMFRQDLLEPEHYTGMMA